MTSLTLPHHSPFLRPLLHHNHHRRTPPHVVRAFRRSDFESYAKRAWRSVNDGFELFVFEARKTAERIDREYSVTRRLSAVAQSAVYRAREIDRDLEIGLKLRNFSMEFGRNWPRYRTQISGFMGTPLGRSITTIFFLWFALSGWLFNFFIFASFILPFAGPLLIGAFANKLVIKGNCPACSTQFIGMKSQIIQCTSCGNIVWQPQGERFPGNGKNPRSSKAKSEVIDVEFEEK